MDAVWLTASAYILAECDGFRISCHPRRISQRTYGLSSLKRKRAFHIETNVDLNCLNVLEGWILSNGFVG